VDEAVSAAVLRPTSNGFPTAAVLVVGDLILDHYIWGRVSRISPEAPVPIVHVESESVRLGGAANVFNNILGIGG
jgi:D-glycero-beta-D-manno-heptose-7-phosphate kinase